MKKILAILLLSSVCVQAQWRPLSTGYNLSLYSVQFFDTLSGIITGDDGLLLRTTDGGQNWNANLDYYNYYPALFSISLYNNSSGWISGRYGTLLQTTDKGQTWTPKDGFSSSVGGYWLSHVAFLNDTVGWMCGGTDALFRTKFGDGYWTKEYVSRAPYALGHLYTKDFASGYLTGDAGIAVKTTDHGYSWTTLNTGVSATLENVTFVNDLTGWIVGDSTTILKTTDGGTSWSRYDTELQYHFNWVTFVDDSVGWIVGSNGAIMKTTNAGATWDKVPSGTLVNLRSIFFKDKNHGYIVGDSGKVLLYDTTFTTSVGSERHAVQPISFEVSQNYPNPFNPTTTISFSIPRDEFVELKVFDVLGKEVGTLTNQKYNAGAHSIQFNASNLASGTYLYRLTAGENVATRKIVLIK
ncbi:MAG TPA: YCF48-related protein [Candidatus Kryptonia bacterium]